MGTEYETMTVEALRKEACARHLGAATWRATARKSDLIRALVTGEAPTVQQTIVGNPYYTPPTSAPAARHDPIDTSAVLALASPEERILDALRELKEQREPVAVVDAGVRTELDAVRDRIAQISDFVGDLQVFDRQHTDAALELDKRLREVEQRAPRELAITVGTLPAVTLKTHHAMLPTMIAALSQRMSNGRRVNVLMVGPAGTGKTHAAEQAAEVLALPYYAISVGPQTTMSHLIGYKDATGAYQRTLFREAVENGGVFLFDEFDAGDASVITCINAATSNGAVAFPDGMVRVHDDFVCIAAGNTYGRGADRQYVGRNQLDAATLSRFVVIDWDYDEALEDAITSNKQWRDRVREIRRKVDQNHVRVVVSTRAIMQGEALLAAGISQSIVEEMVLFKGLDAYTRAKIA